MRINTYLIASIQQAAYYCDIRIIIINIILNAEYELQSTI